MRPLLSVLLGVLLIGAAALEAEDAETRRAAVARLDDQEVPRRVVLQDQSPRVRFAAARRLSDPALLKQVALEDENAGVRYAAVEQLADQETLATIALQDANAGVRFAAAERLTDQARLIEVARGDEHEQVRRVAVSNIEDKVALASIAVEEENPQVRRAALANLADEATWGEWRFRKDPEGLGRQDGWFRATPEHEQWEPIPVPAHWSTTWAGDYLGYGWYSVAFEIPQIPEGRGMMLLFEGVDEQAWVYLNGEQVGEQSAESEQVSALDLWDKPFQVRVDADALNADRKNTLSVLVHASRGTGGIWRPVRVFFRDVE